MSTEGDESFSDFVRDFSPALLRVAWLMTGDHGHAEDLLQNALLKSLRRWRRLENPDKAYAYVRTVLVNTHISDRRRRRVVEDLVEVSPEPAHPAHGLFTPEDRTTAALAALPQGMRAVLVLRFHEDLSEAQTAQVLRCSVGNVKSQSSRGLQRLRAALDPAPDAPADDAAHYARRDTR